MSAPTTRWDGRLYAENAAHHRRYDDDVLAGVRLGAGDRVLDLGCGVGDFTRRLAELVPGGEVLGVDADPDMVATARRRATPNARFVVGRAEELDKLTPAGGYDAVVSVAMLHWVVAADHPRVLAHVRRALRPGGVFRAYFGGHGQVAAMHRLLDEESRRHGGGPVWWFFPTAEQYAPLLAAAGLRVWPDGWVRLVRQRREMDEAAFLGWLRSQTLLAYDSLLPPARIRDFRRAAERRALAEMRGPDGRYDQDFVRLDVLARAG